MNPGHEIHRGDPQTDSLFINGARSAPAVQALVSLIIPLPGRLEYTRLCVPNILRHSRRPFELIFLDVASLDGTADFLQGVAAAAAVPVNVLTALSEEDFDALCAQAVQVARGDYLVWMNNDVLVTPDWLQHLTALADSSPQIGMVGPMSNCGPKSQQVDTVPYRIKLSNESGQMSAKPDLTGLDKFEKEWREIHRGEWAEVEQLGGFCLLVKRDLFRSLPFSGSAEPGTFDGQRMCREARQAGRRLAVCRDLYVHHFGVYMSAPGDIKA